MWVAMGEHPPFTAWMRRQIERPEDDGRWKGVRFGVWEGAEFWRIRLRGSGRGGFDGVIFLLHRVNLVDDRLTQLGGGQDFGVLAEAEDPALQFDGAEDVEFDGQAAVVVGGDSLAGMPLLFAYVTGSGGGNPDTRPSGFGAVVDAERAGQPGVQIVVVGHREAGSSHLGGLDPVDSPRAEFRLANLQADQIQRTLMTGQPVGVHVVRHRLGGSLRLVRDPDGPTVLDANQQIVQDLAVCRIVGDPERCFLKRARHVVQVLQHLVAQRAADLGQCPLGGFSHQGAVQRLQELPAQVQSQGFVERECHLGVAPGGVHSIGLAPVKADGLFDGETDGRKRRQVAADGLLADFHFVRQFADGQAAVLNGEQLQQYPLAYKRPLIAHASPRRFETPECPRYL